MASSLSKTSSSIGVASTSTLQPTNAAQASGLAPLITATAAPALTVLGSPHAASALSGGQSALQLQAGVKSSASSTLMASGKIAVTSAALSAVQSLSDSELQSKFDKYLKDNDPGAVIDELVKWGQSGDRPDFGLNDIDRLIALHTKKLLSEKESNQRPLTSVRSDLHKLTRIAVAHYPNQKMEILVVLTELLESDPAVEKTEGNLLEIIETFNKDLEESKASYFSILLQRKLVRAFSAAVELYLRHYTLGHLPAISDKLKQALIDTQRSIKDFNTNKDSELDFVNGLAIEGSKRLTDNLSATKETFLLLSDVLSAAGNIWNKDFAAGLSKLASFVRLRDKIKNEWFSSLFVMRELVQKAPKSIDKVRIVQKMLPDPEKKVSHEWQFIYGALDILQDVISKTSANERVLFLQVLNGKTVQSDPSQSAATASQPKKIKYHGVKKFVKFSRYYQQATLSKSAAKQADKAIQKKAKMVFLLITTKLKSTPEGEKAAQGLEEYAITNKQLTLKKGLEDHGISVPKKKPRKAISMMSRSKDTSVTPKTTSNKVSSNSSATAAKIAESNPLQQKQQDDKENDVKQTASVTNNIQQPTNLQSATEKPNAKENPPSLVKIKKNEITATAATAVSSRGEILNQKTGDDVSASVSVDPKTLEKTDADGCTPLLHAAKAGNVGLCKTLLAAGANPNAVVKNGLNVLHLAAWWGKHEVIPLFATYKQLLNAKTADGYTPLLLAAWDGHSKACEALLKAGADPLVVDTNGWNALHCAAGYGKHEVIQVLVDHKLPLNEKVNGDGDAPLNLAAWNGHPKACEALLKAGANPLVVNKNGWNALHSAAGYGRHEVIPVFAAYKQLLNAKATNGNTPLLVAAIDGHPKACEALLKAGANPLVVNKDGWNALHCAAEYGKHEVIPLFATYKQLLNAKTPNGNTPLHLAAWKGHAKACEALLKAGANPLVVNKNGGNVLHRAAIKGHHDVIQLFALHKQLLNAQDTNSDTPLMRAAKNGHLKVCEALLKAGADPSITKGAIIFRHSALDLAHESTNSSKDEIIKLLSKHMKQSDAKK